MFKYDDGSTGPLPPGKTYSDYLPDEQKQRVLEALAKILMKDINDDQ